MMRTIFTFMTGLAAFITSAHNLRKETARNAISSNEQSAISTISQLAEKYDCTTASHDVEGVISEITEKNGQRREIVEKSCASSLNMYAEACDNSTARAKSMREQATTGGEAVYTAAIVDAEERATAAQHEFSKTTAQHSDTDSFTGEYELLWKDSACCRGQSKFELRITSDGKATGGNKFHTSSASKPEICAAACQDINNGSVTAFNGQGEEHVGHCGGFFWNPTWYNCGFCTQCTTPDALADSGEPGNKFIEPNKKGKLNNYNAYVMNVHIHVTDASISTSKKASQTQEELKSATKQAEEARALHIKNELENADAVEKNAITEYEALTEQKKVECADHMFKLHTELDILEYAREQVASLRAKMTESTDSTMGDTGMTGMSTMGDTGMTGMSTMGDTGATGLDVMGDSTMSATGATAGESFNFLRSSSSTMGDTGATSGKF